MLLLAKYLTPCELLLAYIFDLPSPYRGGGFYFVELGTLIQSLVDYL